MIENDDYDIMRDDISETLIEETKKLIDYLNKFPYYKNKIKLTKDIIKALLTLTNLKICDAVKVGDFYDFDLKDARRN